jgi:phage protein U
MTAMMLCALGPFTFGLDTAAYQRWTRDRSERWAQADPIGARPALQHLGAGLETLELSGVIHPHFRGGLGQLDDMRRLAAEGEPLQLVTGEGDVLGRWVIASVRERARLFLPGGAPREIRFDLSLRRWGDDA